MMPTYEQPTQAEHDRCTLVHHEAVEMINRLILEGFDRRIIMAGVATAAADLVTTTYGLDAVPTWFANQAMTAKAMIDEAH